MSVYWSCNKNFYKIKDKREREKGGWEGERILEKRKWKKDGIFTTLIIIADWNFVDNNITDANPPK